MAHGTVPIGTSTKIIQNGDVRMQQGNPLSNTIKDISTIMHNPCLNYVGRVTHDCASILRIQAFES